MHLVMCQIFNPLSTLNEYFSIAGVGNKRFWPIFLNVYPVTLTFAHLFTAFASHQPRILQHISTSRAYK